MTIHELSTFPILVSAARLKAAIASVLLIKKHIRLPSLSSAASLRQRGCCDQRQNHDAKSDSKYCASHEASLLCKKDLLKKRGESGESTGSLSQINTEPHTAPM